MRTHPLPVTAETTVLLERLHDRARMYFPDLTPGPVAVTLLEAERRPASRLFRFALSNASAAHQVMVKVPLQRVTRGRHRVAGAGDRPRLAAVTEAETKHLLEHTTLVLTAARFEEVGDPALGAVRVLDHFPEQRAIVTERVQEPTLSRVLKRRGPLTIRFGSDGLRTAFRNAGRWLRVYHGIGACTAATRHAHRSEVLDLAHRYLEFLERHCGRDPLLARARTYCAGVASHALPGELPLGLAHGDFAPRNVFVGPDGRVTGFDMLGRWRAPVYEDLAAFLAALHTSKAQVATLGALTPALRLHTYEDELLRAYFDGAPPVEPLRFYRLLTILDRWAWHVPAVGVAAGPSSALRARATTWLFRRELAACLHDIHPGARSA
jgi:Ser/Thr protein kinase RdoA (MazF antagonist)